MCRLLPVVAAIGLGCCAATDVAADTTLSGPVVDDQTWSGSGRYIGAVPRPPP